jgi:hypothetical protein
LIQTAHSEGRNDLKRQWFYKYDRLMAIHRTGLESDGPLGARELLCLDVRSLSGDTEKLRRSSH